MLHENTRWADTSDIETALGLLEKAAPTRAQGPALAPFGWVHSEFHPASLLFDIDGVPNPLPEPGGSLPPDRPHRVDLNGTDVPVWLNSDHGSWITELHSTGLVRLIWATSWQSAAARTIGPRLGLTP
ncbi:hypothetical protein [Nocardiopsis sp. L17-MgMaSL7]|uniref:hypothetical protein n=1 Tax=Nocardiopsis sp. L17-MgMaSL7 TaxID=1938893 RepID=UPI000D7170CB|nr:hypothetical protein [Nocardiopsis sp. L17-MgMaSL7]PWV48617.1 hypothetical protein BDW27_110170 [Nocardiopsis sp. L17-MgMaSL7]